MSRECMILCGARVEIPATVVVETPMMKCTIWGKAVPKVAEKAASSLGSAIIEVNGSIELHISSVR